MKKLIFLILWASFIISYAQTDSIVFKNGNYVIGEIKSMDRGVVQIETEYSDSDFKIEWDGIKEIYTETRFLLTLSDGKRYNGTFKTTSPGMVTIYDDNGQTRETDINDLVYAKGLDDTFASRVSANLDFGYSLTKANNQQ